MIELTAKHLLELNIQSNEFTVSLEKTEAELNKNHQANLEEVKLILVKEKNAELKDQNEKHMLEISELQKKLKSESDIVKSVQAEVEQLQVQLKESNEKVNFIKKIRSISS